MDFSLLKQAFVQPFPMEKEGMKRAIVILVIGILLAFWPQIHANDHVSISLGDAVIYLCIYALPMGWGAIAAGLAAAAVLVSSGGILYIAYAVIRLVAVIGGRALYCCTSTERNRMAFPVLWCLIALLLGYFCYESVFYGVMTGSLSLLFHLAQWATCMMVGLGLIALFRRIGWDLKWEEGEHAADDIG